MTNEIGETGKIFDNKVNRINDYNAKNKTMQLLEEN